MPQLIVGNWKMHGSLTENAARFDGVRAGVKAHDRVAVCVPFPYLAQAQQHLSGSLVAWGAQDVSREKQGAFTGEVSASMLVDFGCRYAIVGHSERRAYHEESDVLVAEKARAAIGGGLCPIVCVGETMSERESGATDAVVGRQLTAVLTALTGQKAGWVVAYEPVWAIGTGRAADSDDVASVHALLRNLLDAAGASEVPLLYGGSVKATNAETLLRVEHVDGALVGGAALNVEEFLAIIQAGRF